MIRTTVVGSWPIPFGLKPRLTDYYRGAIGDEEAHDVLQAAARIAMDEQLGCGLDQIMGGEVFAPDFVHHVPPRLEGLEIVKKRNHRAGVEGTGRYRIVGDVRAPRGTGHALAYRREKAIQPNLEKAAVPSPLTMTLSLIGDPDTARDILQDTNVVLWRKSGEFKEGSTSCPGRWALLAWISSDSRL